MLPKLRNIHVFVPLEIESCVWATAKLYVAEVVVQCFLFDVLIFTSDQFVPVVDVLCSLIEREWEDLTVEQVIKVACANCPLPKSHQRSLSNCTTTLILKEIVYRHCNLAFNIFFLG